MDRGSRGPDFGPHPERAEDKETEKVPWEFFDEYFDIRDKEGMKRPNIHSFSHLRYQMRRADQERLDHYYEATARRMRERDERRESEGVVVEKDPDAPPTGTVFENFLVAESGANNWLSGKMHRASRYDDVFNGVDAVVEWQSVHPGEEPLWMAVDFTVSGREDTLRKKRARFDNGAYARYFRSGEKDHRGREKEHYLRNIPGIVLGVDIAIYEHIARKGEPMSADHPLRIILLRQAHAQLDLAIRKIALEFFRNPKMANRKDVKRASEVYLELLNSGEVAGGEIGRMFGDFPDNVLFRGLGEKTTYRLFDLLPVQATILDALEQAEKAGLTEEWEELLAETKAHKFLAA